MSINPFLVSLKDEGSLQQSQGKPCQKRSFEACRNRCEWENSVCRSKSVRKRLLEEYRVIVDPDDLNDSRYQEAKEEIMLMTGSIRQSATLVEILEEFIQKIEEIISDRQNDRYDWRRVRLSKQFIFESLQIYWTTYTLDGTFFQCFRNVQDYLERFHLFDQAIPLHLTSLFSATDLFTLDLIQFDGVFLTGVVDQEQIDQILLKGEVIRSDDLFFSFNGPEGPEDLPVDWEAVVGPDLVLTEDQIRAAEDNIRYFLNPDSDPVFLYKYVETSFPIQKREFPFSFPNLNSTSYEIGKKQKKLLEKTLAISTDPVRRAALTDKIRDLSTYLTILEADRDKEGSSLLQQTIFLFRKLQIPIKIQTISADQSILTEEIDFTRVKESYLAQVQNRATTTSQKVLLAIKTDAGYELQGDFSVFLGKYLVDTGTALFPMKQGRKSLFSCLVISIDQADLTLETLVKQVKGIDLSLPFRQPGVGKVISDLIGTSCHLFTDSLPLPESVKEKVTDLLTWGIRNRIEKSIAVSHDGDLDTQGFFSWFTDSNLTSSYHSIYTENTNKNFWTTLLDIIDIRNYKVIQWIWWFFTWIVNLIRYLLFILTFILFYIKYSFLIASILIIAVILRFVFFPFIQSKTQDNIITFYENIGGFINNFCLKIKNLLVTYLLPNDNKKIIISFWINNLFFKHNKKPGVKRTNLLEKN